MIEVIDGKAEAERVRRTAEAVARENEQAQVQEVTEDE
jgi:hypothetical protein